MPTKIVLERQDQFQKIVIENESLRAVILPELGGKIASLISLSSGREFFLQHPDRPYRRARHGDPFIDSDISGFDECLPTVSACPYPEPPFAGMTMPDHGEVWSLPWKHEIGPETVTLEVAGVCLPYRLRRTTRLSGSAVELDYEITNTSDQAFKYLWSAHPLLTIEPGAEIVLPSGISELLVDYSAGKRFMVGQTVAWPAALTAGGEPAQLNTITGPQQKTADKFFTSRMSEGYCGMRIPSVNQAIFFRFNPQEVPYLGVWICQGGFPAEGPPEFTIALEPCNGRPDSLVTAIANRECPELPAGGTHRWHLQIEIQTTGSPERS
jgi:galactose mutarotase-like enzyme